MAEITKIEDEQQNPTSYTREEIADFLYEHLDEFGDKRAYILNAIDYAFGQEPGQDGFVLIAEEDGAIAGAVVINDTNMKGYIPEHILVYIAVDQAHRGKGIGSRLMEHAIEQTKGEIALHVEPDNPARHLYEKYGFTNKYLEMRLTK